MSFPIRRMRRLRKNPGIRRMVRESKLSVDDLLAVGERIINIERLCNIRYGYRSKDDLLHKIYLYYFSTEASAFDKEFIPNIETLNGILNSYYEIHGWDTQGNPAPETLERLELDLKPDELF